MATIIEDYSRFVCRHPYLVLGVVFMLSVSSMYFAGTISMKTSSNKDFLPQEVPAIRTLFTIEDEFGSTNTVYVVVETEPLHAASDEVRDVRDPRVIRYMNNVAQLAAHTDDVIEVGSAASVLKRMNDGKLPQSQREIHELTFKNGLLDRYINRDYTMALVSIRTTDDADMDSLEIELEKIVQQVPRPAGVSVNLGGTILEQQVLKKNIQPDMQKTSTYSLIGILFIVLLLFRSARYGLTPLSTILFGSFWAMGYVGLIGMGLSSATSGVLSMIMGIGIDFGIQVVTRYRLELPGSTPPEAMTVSLSKVILPMSTTTLAALIGFQALHLGKLTFIGEMGTIMSYGVAACMLAAVTAVPALIVIFDSMNVREMYQKFIQIAKVRT